MSFFEDGKWKRGGITDKSTRAGGRGETNNGKKLTQLKFIAPHTAESHCINLRTGINKISSCRTIYNLEDKNHHEVDKPTHNLSSPNRLSVPTKTSWPHSCMCVWASESLTRPDCHFLTPHTFRVHWHWTWKNTLRSYQVVTWPRRAHRAHTMSCCNFN